MASVKGRWVGIGGGGERLKGFQAGYPSPLSPFLLGGSLKTPECKVCRMSAL